MNCFGTKVRCIAYWLTYTKYIKLSLLRTFSICGIWNFQDLTGTHRMTKTNNDRCLRGPVSIMDPKIRYYYCFPGFPQFL